MTPVDGITSPKKNKINRPIKKKQVTKKPAKKFEKPNLEKVTKDENSGNNGVLNKLDDAQKHKIIWVSSIIIVFIIFIIWSSLVLGGNIYANKSNKNNETFFNNLSNDLTGLWDSFKTDYLKIKNSAEELKNEEDRIKELEEQVFPNFDEYK